MVSADFVCGLDMQEGYTALLRAAAYGREDCVQLLIDAGADKNAKDNVCFATVSLPPKFLVNVFMLVCSWCDASFVLASSTSLKLQILIQLAGSRTDGADLGRLDGSCGLCAAAD